MKLAAVIGDPIAHSRSPAIFHFIARALGVPDLRYDLRRVPAGELDAFLAEARRSPELVGFSVTIPHKAAIIDGLDVVDAKARAVGAVNAVRHEGSRLVGFNTDVIGVPTTLTDAGCACAGRDVLMWGAGGAARAVAYALAELGVRRLFLFPSARAGSLAALVHERFPRTRVETTDAPERLPPLSLLVNATPVGMAGVPASRQGVPPEALFAPLTTLPLAADATAFDLVYEPERTPFLDMAGTRGLRVVGGLPMLVDQALATWSLLFGAISDAERRRLRAALGDHLRGTDARPLFLAGFMCAGKSTVGAALAAKLGWRFVDIDSLIAERAALTIEQIFATRGEPAFRELERSAIEEACSRPRSVVALGGGALIDAGNLARVRAAGRLVHLRASAASIEQRLHGAELSRRPLFAALPVGQRGARILELLAVREPGYRAASIDVDTDGRTPTEVLSALLVELGHPPHAGPDA